MKCEKCGISVMKAPLQRVNEKGVYGIWWCEPCIATNEPELARNIKEDETQVEKDLKDILGFK
jgi:hypothetical protein